MHFDIKMKYGISIAMTKGDYQLEIWGVPVMSSAFA